MNHYSTIKYIILSGLLRFGVYTDIRKRKRLFKTNLSAEELKELGFIFEIDKTNFYYRMSKKSKNIINIINSNHEYFKDLNNESLILERKKLRTYHENKACRFEELKIQTYYDYMKNVYGQESLNYLLNVYLEKEKQAYKNKYNKIIKD